MSALRVSQVYDHHMAGELAGALDIELLGQWSAHASEGHYHKAGFYLLDQWMSPAISDESHVGQFDSGDKAVIYRRMAKAFPALIDYLAFAPRQAPVPKG